MTLHPGALTPEEQLEILEFIWGPKYEDDDNYVFCPWIPGTAQDKKERKDNWHEGPAYSWPTDKAEILEFLRQHQQDELYFSPCQFVRNRRNSGLADVERTLWADLDDIDPRDIEEKYRPTIAWQSSPNRFQALWLLKGALPLASEPGNANHRLTYLLGADPSGWDTTQVLRIPGRKNYKPEYREEYPRGAPGRLLWWDGPVYDPDYFADLPEIPAAEMPIQESLMDEALLKGIDRFEVWARVRLKVSKNVREFMALKDVPVDVDRSETLWQIERELADAGCSVAEIVAIIQPSIWNKYSGRNDELKRLTIEATKAVAAAPERAEDQVLEEVDDEQKPTPIDFYDWVTKPLIKPEWIVNDIWSVGGCGFIAGSPKSYKSWFAMDLLLSVATGKPFLGEEKFNVRSPGPVLYIQEEDGEPIVRQRMGQILDGKAPEFHGYQGGIGFVEGYEVRLGHEVNKPEIWWGPGERVRASIYLRQGLRLDKPDWQSWLDETLRVGHSSGAYRLVIVDTLGTSLENVDTDKASDVVKVLAPLKQLAQKHRVGICIVHHNKKGDGDGGSGGGGSRMLGSVALHAWVDDALYLRTTDRLGKNAKVYVSRESKNSMELAFSVFVPHMREDGNQWPGEFENPGNLAWTPDVTLGEERSESSGRRSGNAGRRSSRKAASDSKGDNAGSADENDVEKSAPKKQSVWAELIMSLGGEATTEQIYAIRIGDKPNETRASVRGQLKRAAAMTHAQIEVSGDDSWRVIV